MVGFESWVWRVFGFGWGVFWDGDGRFGWAVGLGGGLWLWWGVGGEVGEEMKLCYYCHVWIDDYM